MSPNAKDTVKYRKKGCAVVEHPVHRQYLTGEDLHKRFLIESSIIMGRTIFEDCKPWFIKPGKDDTCLCRTCEDFRLAKKAATYNFSILELPYRASRIVAKFAFCAITTLRLLKGRKKKINPKLVFVILQQLNSLHQCKRSINELCRSGMSMEKIVECILCHNAMPKVRKLKKLLIFFQFLFFNIFYFFSFYCFYKII